MAGRTRTEEVAMPQHDKTTKTLAIRLDEDLHARLSVLAQLGEITVTDAIRQAIETYVETAKSQGNLAARAAGVLEDIERDANARRSAIQSLFGESETAATAEAATEPPAEPSTPPKRSGRRNPGEETR